MSEIINVKRCPKCSEIKSLDCFSKNKSMKDGFSCHCKSCCLLAVKKWREKNKDKRYVIEKRYQEKNKDKVKEWNRKALKKRVKLISDSYVKHLITTRTNLKYCDVPKELVETYRQFILFKRLIKEQKCQN